MSKLYAVALALLVLAVPAMAQGPWPQNVLVNVEVDQMMELWHSNNIWEPVQLDLTVGDGAAWFGQPVSMSMMGNVNFDVSVAVGANTLNNVRLDIVTNVDQGLWSTRSDDLDGIGPGLEARYDPREYGESDLSGLKSLTGESHVLNVTAAGLPKTKIYTYNAATNLSAMKTIQNLYTLWSGIYGSQPASGSQGTVTVEYTIAPTS